VTENDQQMFSIYKCLSIPFCDSKASGGSHPSHRNREDYSLIIHPSARHQLKLQDHRPTNSTVFSG